MISFLQMSLWAAALTALICIVRAAFGRVLPKRTFRVLWAVVILRMLVPLSLPVTKINTCIAVPCCSNTAVVRDVVVYTYIDGEFAQAGTADRILPQTEYVVSETADGRLPVTEIWLLTAAAVFGVFAAAHIKFRLRVRDAVPAEINFEAGLKRQVRIKVSDRIASPLTYGVFRPVILLPKNIYKCDTKTVEYILAHELTHIRRFDVLYKLFLVIAVSLHWFNPLAWVMLVLASRDIELSCDEEVVLKKNGTGREREEYALTLIEMEEKRSFGVLQSGFGGSSVKERIKSVMLLKNSSAPQKAAAVLLVAAAFTVFTVYDIDGAAAYSVTVSAFNSAEVSYTEPAAEEGAYYSEYAVEKFAETTFIMEETDPALNFAEVLVEDAAVPLLEAEAAEGTYETSEIMMTKMYAVTTAEGTVVRDYPEDYSLYYYGYNDPKTGKAATILVDMNEYAPVDYEQYGLTVSEDKGCFLYGGVPVGGFQCLDFTFVDDIAIRDGGGFFIYKTADDGRFDEAVENGMVQVNTKQFCDITGIHL